jgi:hypothetical protein
MLPDQPTAIGGWTRSPLTGILSCSVGRWGERTRLFQKRVGGPFYCSASLTDGRRHVRSLGTTDHAEALQIVTCQSNNRNGASLLAGHDSLEPHPQVTLARLRERYRRECETFRDTDQTRQSDTAARAAILIAYFGADYDVERLQGCAAPLRVCPRGGWFALPTRAADGAIRARAHGDRRAHSPAYARPICRG